jgi:hypothetical protein
MNVKQQIQEARNKGMSIRQISKQYGVPRTTVFDWTKEKTTPVSSGFVNENLQREKPEKFSKTSDEVLEFLSNLAPIKLDKKVVRKSASSSNSDYAVVIGDMHFPKHCQKTIDIFLQVVEELSPSKIILNGDTIDMLAVSRYPKDIRNNYNLLDERKAYHEFLSDLFSVTDYDTEILEVNANHSGNDVTGRWWRYLSERISELASLPEIREVLSYENIFLAEYSDSVQLVDYANITDDFIILHGDVVRKNGGYSARGMLDKFNISLMHNHTHRFGSTAQRIPGIANRKDKQIFAWENGCACDLNPVYASSPNWQNGFSIIGYDKSDEPQSYSVEQVMVNDGVATVGTLGRTIRAY